MKQQGEKIAVLTSYDASFTTRIEQAGVDVILVGDSLGGVIHGQATTLSVTMGDMLYHMRHVAHARQQTLLISDMPYHSYENKQAALENAKRLMDAGADMVKLEGAGLGAGSISESIDYIIKNDIPVCGHLGLLPQSVEELGGYKVQGREQAAAEQMLADAKHLESIGVDMIVLECIPAALGKIISKAITIPTIGIGAGVDCDGQVLVLYDLLGITPGKLPKFVKDFLATATAASNENLIVNAIKDFVVAVKESRFPMVEQSY
ncbi:3-methyl-2-oxobutanoate hydroxymethyltransferase [hydrothermal vent metagenome]|uniref:3-methyl-2-oxobutanoate hydroxymethyltransferase n=1 Tax=hydrothermal vent metagenome TaxID=652676 RepID=A0A3B0ZII1_9ZZZZ